MANVIGKFCTLGKKNTFVYPKPIPGYTSPEPQVLTEDKQKIKFVYTPITYHVHYDFDGGSVLVDQLHDEFTVESEPYIPSAPTTTKDLTFIGWKFTRESTGEELDSIHGIGDIKAVAQWRENAVLDVGANLNAKLRSLSDGEEIMAIQYSPTVIKETEGMNISSTRTPIYARFDAGIVYIYCGYDIYCNENMSGAFKDFILLRDIYALKYFICKRNTDISEIFSGCKLLSDVSPIENWADGKFFDYTDAFKDTAAIASSRVPSWYRWDIKVKYSYGKNTDTVDIKVIPGETIYPVSIAGYTSDIKSIVVDDPNKEYIFTYTPITYHISYIVDGKEITNPGLEDHYSTGNIDYYPPDISKEGYTFSGWSPECIYQGDYGDVTFIATFNKN